LRALSGARGRCERARSVLATPSQRGATRATDVHRSADGLALVSDRRKVLRHVFGHHQRFEACDARVLIGFHFRDAVDKGLKRGRLIGHWTIEQVLQPQRTR
jgi:hypothetical protein